MKHNSVKPIKNLSIMNDPVYDQEAFFHPVGTSPLQASTTTPLSFPKLRVGKLSARRPYEGDKVFPHYNLLFRRNHEQAIVDEYPLAKALIDDDLAEIIRILKQGFQDFYIIFYSEGELDWDPWNIYVYSPLDLAKSEEAKRLLLHHNAQSGEVMYKEDQEAYRRYRPLAEAREKAEANARIAEEQRERQKMVEEYLKTSK